MKAKGEGKLSRVISPVCIWLSVCDLRSTKQTLLEPKKMGSGKLIPLPQVLSILTWFSAFHGSLWCAARSVRTVMCQVHPLRVEPGPFWCVLTWLSTLSRTVRPSPSKLTCPLQDLFGLEMPDSILLTGCHAWPCAFFLARIFPFQVECGLVISPVTKLDTMVCAILPSRHRLVYSLRNKLI